MPRVPSAEVTPLSSFLSPIPPPSLFLCTFPHFPLTPQSLIYMTDKYTDKYDHSIFVFYAVGVLIVNDMVWMRGLGWGWRREGKLSPNLATVSSVMTPPSLWKTILFCLHLHESSFFLLFCSQRSHGTFANIFKSCKKQDFFFFCCFFFFFF